MADKFEAFRSLHQPGNPFIIPNPWDIGSAKMLASLGAKALATTSAGFAFTRGRPDMGYVSRDDMLAHAEDIVSATDLPVSADLENGYADTPDGVAETVKLSYEVGLAGCSIEDTQLPSTSAYDEELAIERIRAAVAMSKTFERPFMITARADGYMNKAYDEAEAKRRLLAYAELGADVIYAPLLPFSDILDVTRKVDVPLNALAAGKFTEFNLTDFTKIGVARISLGSSLARATHTLIHTIGKKLFEEGDFSSMSNVMGGDMIDPLLDIKSTMNKT